MRQQPDERGKEADGFRVETGQDGQFGQGEDIPAVIPVIKQAGHLEWCEQTGGQKLGPGRPVQVERMVGKIFIHLDFGRVERLYVFRPRKPCNRLKDIVRLSCQLKRRQKNGQQDGSHPVAKSFHSIVCRPQDGKAEHKRY